MNFACLIKINGIDQYLNASLRECSRDDALVVTIAKKALLEETARRRFGKDWQKHCAIEFMDYTEFMRYCGRKGGHKQTPEKKAAMKRVAAERWPFKKYRLKRFKTEYLINARSVGMAVDLIKSYLVIHPVTFQRHSTILTYTPKPLRDVPVEEPAAFIRTHKNSEWRRLN